MTNDVVVTRADRERGADWVIAPANAAKIRRGEMDWNPMVIAFARHRIEALAAREDRAFPDAGDGREVLPMQVDLWAAGLDNDTARFVARMLMEKGYNLVGSDEPFTNTPGPETSEGSSADERAREKMRDAFMRVQSAKRAGQPDMQAICDAINSIPAVLAVLDGHAEFVADVSSEGPSA